MVPDITYNVVCFRFAHSGSEPSITVFKSRRNATFWTKAGKMGVGQTGVGEQVPIPR